MENITRISIPNKENGTSIYSIKDSNAVSFAAQQELEESEKQLARNNIGASEKLTWKSI